jgi:hypothetical protein
VTSRHQAALPGWLVPAAVALVVFAGHVRSPNVTIADSQRTIPLAESMVHGSLDLRWAVVLPAQEGTHGLYRATGDEGPVYSSYPLGPGLLAVPVVAGIDLLAKAGVGRSARDRLQHGSWALERLVASIVVALTAAVLYLVSLVVLTGSLRRRRLVATAVALTFAFGTGAWSTASRALWQHGPSMLLLSLALLVAVRSRSDPRLVALLGLPVAAAYVTRPTNLIPLLAFSVWVAVCHRRQALGYLLGLAAIAVPFVLVNLHSYGAVLSPYYRPGGQGRNAHVVEALVGNLVSPARGLFVFSPVLFLGVAGAVRAVRRHRFDGVDVVVWTSVVLHWVVISTTAPDWWGGHSFGPRLFTDMIPFLVYSALPVLQPAPATDATVRRSWPRPVAISAVTVLLVVSMAVHFQGATMRSTWCWNDEPVDVDEQPRRVWSLSPPQALAGYASLAGGASFASESVEGGSVMAGCPGPSGAPRPQDPASGVDP